MGVLMTEEINSDVDDPVVSAERFARLEQRVTDHIKVCDRLKELADQLAKQHGAHGRWMLAQLMIGLSTLVVLLNFIYSK